ncbi:MAG: hypothetical protein KGN16_24920 [Burkholderiales bacterium]|nr:hypothetical protein [Burkholderiales bacterium]
MNKPLLSAVFTACALFAGHSFAADSCADQAAAKKLNGAAKTSFVKKCEKTAGASACAAQAAEKKLNGAAKNSFVKKCEKDAGAAPAAAK